MVVTVTKIKQGLSQILRLTINSRLERVGPLHALVHDSVHVNDA
jgi:hypothetical protein